MSKKEARQNLPEYIRERAQIIKRGDIMVAMDCAEASRMVYASFDGGHSWDGTPFQTADFRHNLNVATLRRIDRWAGRA